MSVSIITPCYNGETYVSSFFESILAQTYQDIELIFINDGSKDHTEEIANSFRVKLEERGIRFVYIYQENRGQAAALNRGLSIFKGDYLVWTDADDIIFPNNIEEKVRFLEQHNEFGLVVCKGQIVNENDLNTKIKDYYRIKPEGEDTFFMDILRGKNVVFTPGVYMVRRSVVLQAIPNLAIIESRIGQNFQMLLPITYHTSCGYIDQLLFSYVQRNDSHSNNQKSESDWLIREKELEKLLEGILKEISPEVLKKYKTIIEERVLRDTFDIAYRFSDEVLLESTFKELKRRRFVSTRDRLIYLAGKFMGMKLLYQIYTKLKNKTVI